MALFFSILALIFAIIGLIPLLGILEWIAMILSVLGIIFGIIGLIVKKSKGTPVAAIIINVLVALLSIVRILIGLAFL